MNACLNMLVWAHRFWPRLVYPRSSREFDTQWKLIWDVWGVDETYLLTLLTWGFMQRPVLRHTDPFRNLYHLKIHGLRPVLYLGASFRYGWRMPAVCTLTSLRETWRWEQTLLRFVILGGHAWLVVSVSIPSPFNSSSSQIRLSFTCLETKRKVKWGPSWDKHWII